MDALDTAQGLTPARRQSRPSRFPARGRGALRTAWAGALVWTAMLIVQGGCGARLTGSYVLPMPPEPDAGPALMPSTNLYVRSPTILHPSDHDYDEEDRRWRDSRGRLRSAMTDLLVDYFDASGLFGDVRRYDDARPRELDGDDLILDVSVVDLFYRPISYALLVAWRRDEYALSMGLDVRSPSGASVFDYTYADQVKCGVNSIWIVDVLIPLFPVYIDKHEKERAALLDDAITQSIESIRSAIVEGHFTLAL